MEKISANSKLGKKYVRAYEASTWHTLKNARYYAETVESVVIYFLANITNWRGDDAKRIKAELKSLLK